MTDINIRYITPADAAQIAGVTPSTVRRWLETYNIGIKIVGRWKVDYEKLLLLMSGDLEDGTGKT